MPAWLRVMIEPLPLIVSLAVIGGRSSESPLFSDSAGIAVVKVKVQFFGNTIVLGAVEALAA